jgi:hypothetical protein
MSGRFDLSTYVDVATRLQRFYEKYPEGSIQSEIVHFTDARVVVKAYAFRNDKDGLPATGHAAEIIPHPNAGMRGSELMVCETSAWGRALAALGFEVKNGISSADEMSAAQERRTEAPTAPVAPKPEPDYAKVWESESVTLPSEERAPLTAGAALSAALADACPRHGNAWQFKQGKTKDGRDYAFWACPTRDEEGFCKKRPTIEWVNARER